jgi:hypothetical protein
MVTRPVTFRVRGLRQVLKPNNVTETGILTVGRSHYFPAIRLLTPTALLVGNERAVVFIRL